MEKIPCQFGTFSAMVVTGTYAEFNAGVDVMADNITNIVAYATNPEVTATVDFASANQNEVEIGTRATQVGFGNDRLFLVIGR